MINLHGKGYNCTVVWGRECWGYRGGGEGEREQGEGESVRAGDGTGEQGNALCSPSIFPPVHLSAFNLFLPGLNAFYSQE